MANTYQDREAWIAACADRYESAGGLRREQASHFAEACADQQEALEGPFALNEWQSPSDAADDDMSYWENDE